MLAREVSSGVYLHGDDLIERNDQPFEERISKAVAAAAEKGCSLAITGKNVFIAYPLRDQDWKVISEFCEAQGVEVRVVTLALNERTALSNRGTRDLTEEERQRVSQMFVEGYHARTFSHLIVDNDSKQSQQAVSEICKFFGF